MAGSDSQIDEPQHGRPKRAELQDVNINTGAQSIDTEQSFPHREEARRSSSLLISSTSLHKKQNSIFEAFNEEREEMVFFVTIDFRAFKHHLDLVTKPLSDRHQDDVD